MKSEEHVKILGIIYIVFGALGILGSIVILSVLMGGSFLTGEEEAIFALTLAGFIISSYGILISLPGIIGGIGLIYHRGWARILVVILGILKLLNIPVGTAIGIYTLWVLMQDDTVKLFEK